jgi:hypothetical protein
MRATITPFGIGTSIPRDGELAVLLLVLAAALMVAAVVLAHVPRTAITFNVRRFVASLIGNAGDRGVITFWTVWALMGASGICVLTATLIFWAIYKVA